MLGVLVLVIGVFLGNAEGVKVIVVGAGPAGIAAATTLLSQGIDVTVLEAEDRIGGRVHSVPFGDAVVDMGAEWCHGQKNNVVYEMVKHLGVLQSSNYSASLFMSDRKVVGDQLTSDMHELFEEIYSPDGNKKQEEGVTVGEYFIKRYNESARQKFSGKDLDICLLSLDLMHHYVQSSEGAFSWFDTSANSDYRNCEGDLSLNWNGFGYKTALEVLMRKHPRVYDPSFPIQSKIQLNKVVQKISWDDGVNVSCTDGTFHTAKHLIFTPSLGVLKYKHRRMFSPPLPRHKVRAIRDLGIGAVMKVLMHFEKRWWPEEFNGYSFVWTHEHRDMLIAEFTKGPSRYGRSWLLNFMSVLPLERNPNALSAWITGDLVPEIEKTSNETLIDGLHFALDKFLGHKFNITKPDKILRTNWYANQNFRGTYSFQTTASRRMKDPSSNEILAEPLKNVQGVPTVLFAGEATHSHYYSTVHGAIETGRREANRILHFIQDAENELS
ncbi:PREDICTED: spermine oxidase-like [Nicrophorus vespilloides]|uniref:Spermine oxidase-like n=1 Tax=Nicrophorus vespilloides TaxID=110193 RepID=A0ABM1NEU2_NICVS|nr:PREDICTED: spermine oxidase-like [Nicrophorus vespilloides]